MPLSMDVYEKARKKGAICYRQRIERGQNPYLPVLDSLIDGLKVLKERRLPVQEILLDNVIGTKTEGRTNAFANNFMPLLEANSEFADKWMRLYDAQMNEGIRDAIKVYELAGRYFVQEGNKRVSVLKYTDSPAILADVHELIVETEDTAEGKIYHEFLKFTDVTGVHEIWMSQPKNYQKLLKLINPEKLEKFNDELRRDLRYNYRNFYTVFKKMGGMELNLTPGDAYLLYLDEFGYNPQTVLVHSVLEKELEKIWSDFALYPKKKEVKLTDTTETSDHTSLISALLIKEPLKVAFIDAKDAVSSSWTDEHAKAREILSKEMANEINMEIYDHANSKEDITRLVERAIADGNQVIFFTNPSMLQIANKYAAKYPKIKFLNCSLDVDTGILRTYFPREFEVQFLMGVLAGIMSNTNKIGYIASYPIMGIVANINAFAIGVQMTNPQAKVYLDWSTTSQALVEDYPTDIDMLYIEGEKFSMDFVEDRKYGLFDVRQERFAPLATQIIHWDVFYKKILKSILNNTWKSDAMGLDTESINYWWGMSNGLLELNFTDDVPYASRRLADELKKSLTNNSFHIFSGKLYSQDGLVYDNSEPMSLDETAKMDWLNDNIVGCLPKESQITETADPIVAQYGVDKVLDEEEE